MTTPPSKLEEIRRGKLAELRALGVDPFGQRLAGRTMIAAARESVPEPLPPDPALLPEATIAGRILGLRDTGKAIFLDVQDLTGQMQVLVGKKQVGNDWQVAGQLDLWDWVWASGRVGKTRTGETTLFASRIGIATKTLAHPPDKFHGAQDQELLLRRRYVDLIQSPEAVRRFQTRSMVTAGVRDFFRQRGYLEVETPTMQSIPGGAAARPFITHHNALDIDLFLRIAPELYLKRLLVGGIERVYEIGRVWRNEGIDSTHNPEFTMLEAYEAFGDYRTMLELTKELIQGLAAQVDRSCRLPFGERTIDFSRWEEATYRELLERHAGVRMEDEGGVIRECQRRGIPTTGRHPDLLVGELFDHAVEDHLVGPVFVLDYPASLCPLTKRKKDSPNLAERFELYIAGMEMANAYTELNDPVQQEELFLAQLAGQKEEDRMGRMDRDFLLALRHGMPPAGGLGIGIDRLVMLLTNTRSIRDVILFPLLRPVEGEARVVGPAASLKGLGTVQEPLTPNPSPAGGEGSGKQDKLP